MGGSRSRHHGGWVVRAGATSGGTRRTGSVAGRAYCGTRSPNRPATSAPSLAAKYTGAPFACALTRARERRGSRCGTWRTALRKTASYQSRQLGRSRSVMLDSETRASCGRLERSSGLHITPAKTTPRSAGGSPRPIGSSPAWTYAGALIARALARRDRRGRRPLRQCRVATGGRNPGLAASLPLDSERRERSPRSHEPEVGHPPRGRRTPRAPQC